MFLPCLWPGCFQPHGYGAAEPERRPSSERKALKTGEGDWSAADVATRLLETACERLMSPGHGSWESVCVWVWEESDVGPSRGRHSPGSSPVSLTYSVTASSGATDCSLAIGTGAQSDLPEVTWWGCECGWSVPRVRLSHGWLDHRLPGAWARVPALGSGLGFSLCEMCVLGEGPVGVSTVLMPT